MSCLRILLVGFMGSGKTDAGKAVAGRLGWTFADVDALVAAGRGMSISEIFERFGEPAFRSDETRITADCLCRDRIVIASGGGWAAAGTDRLSSVPEGTCTIWLEVSPEEAVRRIGIQSADRPLLNGPGALETARELLARRTPFYAGAQAKVDTDGFSVEDVTVRILRILSENVPPGEAE